MRRRRLATATSSFAFFVVVISIVPRVLLRGRGAAVASVVADDDGGGVDAVGDGGGGANVDDGGKEGGGIVVVVGRDRGRGGGGRRRLRRRAAPASTTEDYNIDKGGGRGVLGTAGGGEDGGDVARDLLRFSPSSLSTSSSSRSSFRIRLYQKTSVYEHIKSNYEQDEEEEGRLSALMRRKSWDEWCVSAEDHDVDHDDDDDDAGGGGSRLALDRCSPRAVRQRFTYYTAEGDERAVRHYGDYAAAGRIRLFVDDDGTEEGTPEEGEEEDAGGLCLTLSRRKQSSIKLEPCDSSSSSQLFLLFATPKGTSASAESSVEIRPALLRGSCLSPLHHSPPRFKGERIGLEDCSSSWASFPSSVASVSSPRGGGAYADGGLGARSTASWIFRFSSSAKQGAHEAEGYLGAGGGGGGGGSNDAGDDHNDDYDDDDDPSPLPELSTVPERDCTASAPCSVCQGDCDDDAECDEGLVCLQRLANEVVPGCRGRGEEAMDYCYDPLWAVPPGSDGDGGSSIGGAGVKDMATTTAPKFTVASTKPAVVATVAPLPKLATVPYNDGDCTKSSPCSVCQGDCDGDRHCAPGLICYQRSGYEPVPGCSGRGEDGTDYCYDPDAVAKADGGEAAKEEGTAPAPTAAAKLPELVIIPDEDCTSSNPCGLCEGDCDGDSQCAPGLVCIFRGGYESVPGCKGKGEEGKDYCGYPILAGEDEADKENAGKVPATIAPTAPATAAAALPELSLVPENDCPANERSCAICRGDCDSDADCSLGLVCFQRSGFDSVPGCRGRGEEGADYCVTEEAMRREACKGNGVDLTAYDYSSSVPPRPHPPRSSAVSSPRDAPQFVSLTFDDNGYADSMNGLLRMLSTKSHLSDGSPVLATFYHTTAYIERGGSSRNVPVHVKKAWRRALELGHEVGLHSHDHARGGETFDEYEWTEQIDECRDRLTRPYDPDETNESPDDDAGIGVDAGETIGWRSPFLTYNDDLFDALVSNKVWYDTSVEDGWKSEYDGTNYVWPYTLDEGRPGVYSQPTIKSHPGLWEIPVHPVIVPPDELAEEYGIERGLREKCARLVSWFDKESGKITCFDYNLWVQFQMTPTEFLATLMYTLDLRLSGNRAPFIIGFHSDYYSDSWTTPDEWAPPAGRRWALEKFVDYALSKSGEEEEEEDEGVRLVPVKEVLGWMRDPVPRYCGVSSQ